MARVKLESCGKTIQRKWPRSIGSRKRLRGCVTPYLNLNHTQLARTTSEECVQWKLSHLKAVDGGNLRKYYINQFFNDQFFNKIFYLSVFLAKNFLIGLKVQLEHLGIRVDIGAFF